MSWKVSISELVSSLSGDFSDSPDVSKTQTVNAGSRSQVERAMANLNKQVKNASADSGNLESRADQLSKIFSGGGMRFYDRIKPLLDNLSEPDLKRLQTIYKQKNGRDLLKDCDDYLPLDSKIQAFEKLAPERIHRQTEPLGMDAGGKGIKMDPPAKEVLSGSQVQYRLDLDGETGSRRVSHLIQGDNARIEEDGDNFTGDYSRVEQNGSYRVTFQVKYNGELPEFYTYNTTVSSGETKAANELGKLEGGAPDSEIYLAYLDNQIGGVKQAISELQNRRDAVFADIQNSVGNSADKYDELRRLDKQLETLKNKLPEMETARTNVADALGGGESGKPIPLKAVLIARENGRTIPLQLYAKNLGGGKWAIIDVTNPSNPRTWTGEGALPADALNQAWKNFVGGTNDLPAGQIAAVHPPGLGFSENANWNAASSGRSLLKAWANGLGAGSIALVVLAGVAAVATEGAAIPILLASGVLGGASAGFNSADRISNGTFKLKSSETALDLLGIVGGIASLGGLGAMTNAGRTLLANGAKFTVQNLGNVTKIAQIADTGLNVAGGILIANQYVEAIDKVNRSSMSDEQKATATRSILAQAVLTGGLIVLGVGISTKLSKVAESSNFKEIESNWLNKEIKVGDPLPEGYNWKNGQISRNPNKATENYTPIMAQDGLIVIRENIERLSNPNTMRNNFKPTVENQLKAKGLTGEALTLAVDKEMSRVQIHHIIPDELIRNTELGKAAQKAGYNLDEAGNLKGMPRKAGDRIDDFDVEHRGSHPQYTLRVQDRIDQIERKLIQRYKSIDNVPAIIINRKMKELENEFRNLIETNQVPMKNKKLAFFPLERMTSGGLYEIRV